jgi:hypothetical protein
MHHRGLLGIDGNADLLDALVFTNRHGRRLPRSGARPIPPVEPPPPPAASDRHPFGERLDSSAVCINVVPSRGP